MKLFASPPHSQWTVEVARPTDVLTPDGVREGVRLLYQEHSRGLYVTLRRLSWPGADVDDLLHEVFVIALRRGRALLLAESPKAWLYGIATRVAAAAGRKHRWRELLGLTVRPPPPAPAVDFASKDSVHRALAAMTPKKREVLVLFELQGFSGPEIAAILRCSLKTVWTRLHYARRDFERLVAADE